jgi:hypothetical protein
LEFGNDFGLVMDFEVFHVVGVIFNEGYFFLAGVLGLVDLLAGSLGLLMGWWHLVQRRVFLFCLSI